MGVTELRKCPKCDVLPVQETYTHMPSLKEIRDGGYSITFGRYVCPVCGDAPSWGKSYSIHGGFDEKHIKVWNDHVHNRSEGVGA